MKVTVLGASGHAGSEITKELARRGHHVTGIARTPSRIPQGDNIQAIAGDVNHKEDLLPHLQGADAVVSALMFSDAGPDLMLDLVKTAGVKRYLVVGGAGSLEVAPSVRLVDTPEFPDEYKPEASVGVKFLERLKQETELDWTFLSPSIFFEDGPRTEKFRFGTDSPIFDADGKSSISFADYAIAMVDEIENPAHSRRRFTVGY